MKVHVIRHGRSEFNQWRINQIMRPWKWFDDPPEFTDAKLTLEGVDQARRAGEKYKDIIQNCQLIICSPLTRAIQTMQILTRGLDIPVVISPLVTERTDTMCDIGRTYSELKAEYKMYELLHFEKEHWWHHDGEDPMKLVKEDKELVAQRVRAFMDFLAERGVKEVLLVSHCHFLSEFLESWRPLANCELKTVSFNYS